MSFFFFSAQPFLVSELLPGHIIPALYATVELKLERIVDLGPFKHKVKTRDHLQFVEGTDAW